MLIGAIYLSFAVPLSAQGVSAIPATINKPYIVQATVDAARLIGIPPARVVRDSAKKAQTPDYVSAQLYYVEAPVSWRRLFFRKYFQ